MREMARNMGALAATGALLGALFAGDAAFAQRSGGVLKVYFFDSPASMSIHEEATIAGQGPAMGVFNNLVMYNQDVPQSGLQSIVADLASEWSWDEDKTQLTFRLREGIHLRYPERGGVSGHQRRPVLRFGTAAGNCTTSSAVRIAGSCRRLRA
jgi:ABC-type transport system substrate-binding protein